MLENKFTDDNKERNVKCWGKATNDKKERIVKWWEKM